jgi:hypothetical protein
MVTGSHGGSCGVSQLGREFETGVGMDVFYGARGGTQAKILIFHVKGVNMYEF